MTKRFAALLSATTLIITAFAADDPHSGLTAANAFVDAPPMLLPSIDRTTRLDMIDYFNAGSDKESKNLFDSGCRITELSPEQLTFATSEVGTRQITILPAGRDSVIMMITTLLTPVPDSEIAFFSADWKPLKSKAFSQPELSEWLPDELKRDRDALAEAENIYPFILASASYDSTEGVLTLTNNLNQYLLPEDERAASAPELRHTLRYRWTGKKMILLKE